MRYTASGPHKHKRAQILSLHIRRIRFNARRALVLGPIVISIISCGFCKTFESRDILSTLPQADFNFSVLPLVKFSPLTHNSQRRLDDFKDTRSRAFTQPDSFRSIFYDLFTVVQGEGGECWVLYCCAIPRTSKARFSNSLHLNAAAFVKETTDERTITVPTK